MRKILALLLLALLALPAAADTKPAAKPSKTAKAKTAAPAAKPAAAAPAPAAASDPGNLMTTWNFAAPVEVDNLWDGVNKDGEIQLKPIEVYFTDNGRHIDPGKLGNPICYADADGDGVKELVLASECGFIWLFKRANKTWPPKFESGRFLHAFFGAAVTGVDICDMDGDGIPDLVVGADKGQIFSVKGKGNGLFNLAEGARNYLTGNGEGESAYSGRQLSPRIVDWNGDGIQDLIYGEGSYSANSVYVLFNKGSNAASNFRNQKPQWLAYGYGREQLAPTVADFNGDGKPDLLIGALDGGLHLYLNVGFKESQTDSQYLLEYARTATFEDVDDHFFKEGPRPFLADLNGDKKPDLLVSARDGRVYASQFVGPMERCQFTKPVAVTAPDRRKPYPGPPKGTWYGHHEDDSYTYWNPARYGGANTACNVKYMQGTDPETGEKYAYARAYYEDGYLGGASYLAKYYDDCITTAEYGKNYRLSFKARGLLVKPVVTIRQVYEKKVVGDHVETLSPSKDQTFSVNGEWQDCAFNFTPEFISNRRERPAISVSFKMQPEGTNAYLDIRDIKFKLQ